MIVSEEAVKYLFFVDGKVREKLSRYNEQSEGKQEHQIHDRLFKLLIHTYFEEFMELFFPKFHSDIDFTGIKPLSEEMFTDVFKGVKRQADIVIEAKLRGENSLIIIHVEPQSTYERNFNKRMFQYYTLLYNRYRKPILPIAVYSYDEKRDGQNSYEMFVTDFKVVSFQFLKVQLSTKNWRKFLTSDNPVAAALLSKMNYSESERIMVIRAFFRMLIRMKLPDEESEFLMRFFEHYLKLDEKEEEQLMSNLKYTDDWEEIKKLPISWEEHGIKKGRVEGREETAIKLMEEGVDISLIKKVTELSEERIKELMEKLN